MQPSSIRLVALCLSVMLASCAQTQRSTQGAMVPVESGRTLVYECGDLEFIARTGPGEIALYLPDDYRVLGQERVASGARYSDGDVTLWTKGNEASLEIGSRRLTSCQLNPARAPWEEARRRGVSFRAVGQEPSWYLEIHPQRSTLFVAAYGNRRVLLPSAESVIEGAEEVYDLTDGQHDLKVEISLQYCADIMSGQAFDNRVIVTLNGERFDGCGSALAPWWDQT